MIMPTKFFRTPQGTHAHSTWGCARTHQPVPAPEPTVIPATELAGYTPCAMCCSFSQADEIVNTAPVNANCTGVMVPANPRRLYRRCECGYEGKVGNNGLRAHKPKK